VLPFFFNEENALVLGIWMWLIMVKDYEWEYRLNNRFSYFGNGFSQREIDGDNITWYIDGV
jgi:hypothetical protein